MMAAGVSDDGGATLPEEPTGNGGTNPPSFPPPPKILTSTEGLQTLDEDQGEDTAVIKDMEMQG